MVFNFSKEINLDCNENGFYDWLIYGDHGSSKSCRLLVYNDLPYEFRNWSSFKTNFWIWNGYVCFEFFEKI